MIPSFILIAADRYPIALAAYLKRRMCRVQQQPSATAPDFHAAGPVRRARAETLARRAT